MTEKKFLDLDGLKHYNSKLKNGTVVVGKAAAANQVPSTGIQWGTDTVPLANIPKAALERCYIVANDAARLAWTTAQVQNGDTVKVSDTNKMYFVKDDTKLNNENGYEPYTSGTSVTVQSVDWANVTNKPTKFIPEDHGSNVVTSLAGYTPNSPSVNKLEVLHATDTLNQALNKISKNILTLSQYVYMRDLVNTNTKTKVQLFDKVKGTDTITSYRVLDDRVSGGADINVGTLYETTDTGKLRVVQVIETYAIMDENRTSVSYSTDGGPKRYWRDIDLRNGGTTPTWSEWKLCIDKELITLIEEKIKPTALPFDSYVNNPAIQLGTANAGNIVYDRARGKFLCFNENKYYPNWVGDEAYGESSAEGIIPNEKTLYYHRTDGIVYVFNKQGNSLDSVTGNISRISDQEINDMING